MRRSKLLLCLTATFAQALLSGGAFAFPSNTRYGYASCTSCHVSPSGGGVLNNYGRMSAAEVLSTWAYPTEEQPLHGILNPIWPEEPKLLVGGDVRYLALSSRYPGGSLEKNFFMQRDVELAVPLTPGVYAVAAGGLYAKGLDGDAILQSRRHYLLLNFNQNFSLRAGRFFANYGIMLEDHTAATRRGVLFDEGKETYNIEASLRDARGEITLTTVAAGVKSVALSQDGVVADANGVVARAALYVGKASQVGVSALYLKTITPGKDGQEAAFGPFAMLGFTDFLYALTEVDAVRYNGEEPHVYSYNLLAWEIFKGFHLGAVYQRRGAQDEVGPRIEWFPRPHFQLAAAYSRTYNVYSDQQIFKADGATLLLHYYL